MSTGDLAPIVLFAYARPRHTRKTLEALSRNALADQCRLFIFCDGPPVNASVEKRHAIEQVRQIAQERNWCGSVEIRERADNRGLADSITSGVTEVVQQFGRVIVLEDDLVTAPGFLTYMNAALNLYSSDEVVMQISGFSFPAGWFPPSTGFLRASHPWGWATWSRAWQHYSNDATALLRAVEQKGSAAFDLDGAAFHFDELKRNSDGRLKTWAVRWYASVFLRNGLVLYPGRSLVQNIGFDGTGENCHSAAGIYQAIPMATEIVVNRIPLTECQAILRSHQRHYRAELARWTGNTFPQRLRRKCRSLLSQLSRGFGQRPQR